MDFFTDPFAYLHIPLDSWTEAGLTWVVEHFRPFFQAYIREPIRITLEAVESILQSTPPPVILGLVLLLGWQVAGLSVGIVAFCCMFAIGAIGGWPQSMTTLSIVLTAIMFCTAIGIPLGILSARSNRAAFVIRPVLDLMQTIPSFVYLIPVVMLFGIGNVPGVIVTIIYALAPVIRLTNLGIRQVSHDMVEAAEAFGASPRQVLYKVQIPLAVPTIMAGVNQTIMMALSMSVVASMISVTGLGLTVLRGIGQLNMGLATVGGAGIVLLAVTIDRISQGFGRSVRDRGHKKWYESGPIGLVLRASPSAFGRTGK
ncbi:MAG: ABC transporter permease subunit [Parvibaculaceae bacterium]